jgi:HEAT repeat protein
VTEEPRKEDVMKFAQILLITVATALALWLGLGTALAQDGEASLREAREALNRARYAEAAEMYESARASATEQAVVAETLYWEAFSRYRTERTRELKRALALLEMQRQFEVSADMENEREALEMRIAGALAERGEADGAKTIYQELEKQQQREETRVAALHALMQMDPDKALPILEKIVRGETKSSTEMRHNAVFMLCNEDERGVDIVLEVLPTVDDPELVQAMVMCLAQSDDERVVDVLVDVMRRTDDAEIAQMVLMSLGHAEDPRAFDVLAEIARDPQRDPELRAHALFGLAQTGDDRVAGIAAAIIRNRDEDHEVMEGALMALVMTGDSDGARSALLEMARDTTLDGEFRAQALFMAGQHGYIEPATLLEIYRSTDSRDLKQQICHVLTQLDDGDEAFAVLLEIVQNEEDQEIRRDAVFWMGQFDDPRAAEFLMELINAE